MHAASVLLPVFPLFAVLLAAAAVASAGAERRRALRAWLEGPAEAPARRRAGARPAGAAADRLRADLARVGWAIGVEEWAAIRVAVAGACGLLLALLAGMVSGRLLFALPAALVGVLIGQGAPVIAWQAAVGRRQRRVDAELLAFTDLLGVLVEAGMPFDSAARWACAETRGVLAGEFSRVLAAREHQAVGTQAALTALAERLGHPEVRYLADAIADGAEMGRGLGDSLRGAAAALRAMRYEALQRRAQTQGIHSGLLLSVFATIPTLLIIIYPGLRLISQAL